MRAIPEPQTWDASLILGIIYTLLYAMMIGFMMTVTIPPENEKAIGILAGAMTIIQTQIVGYFFGSNKIADDNQRLIAKRLVEAPVATPTIKTEDVKVDATGAQINIEKK